MNIHEIIATTAQEFAEWLQERRWFHYNINTKKWHHTHEQGTLSKEEVEKYYRKTTSQLFTQFYIEKNNNN